MRMARKMQTEKVHDRTSGDLPINSRVAVAIVSDPYSKHGEKIQVTRSVRDDPLADMRARNLIDEALYLAGRKWQRLHDISEIGPISAIDPSKEAVDGGRIPEAITDRQIDAFRELGKADMVLGQWGGILVRNLLAHRMTVGQMAVHHNCVTARQQNFLSMRVRECLEDLAKMWGYAG